MEHDYTQPCGDLKYEYRLQQDSMRSDAGKLPEARNGIAVSGCWYRIARHPADDAICITYTEANARLVCEALNATLRKRTVEETYVDVCRRAMETGKCVIGNRREDGRWDVTVLTPHQPNDAAPSWRAGCLVVTVVYGLAAILFLVLRAMGVGP